MRFWTLKRKKKKEKIMSKAFLGKSLLEEISDSDAGNPGDK